MTIIASVLTSYSDYSPVVVASPLDAPRQKKAAAARHDGTTGSRSGLVSLPTRLQRAVGRLYNATAPLPPPCASTPCCVGRGATRVCWDRPTVGHGRPYRILFFTNALGFRGTPVAMFDYMNFFEELACGQPFIASFDSFDSGGREVFDARFPGRQYFLHEINASEELNALVDRLGVDAVFTMQSGETHNTPFDKPRHAKLLILAVFKGMTPHGDAYAVVSGSAYHVPSVRVVPHIVYVNASLEGAPSLRAELGIPPAATVFCRHGGWHTFNLEWARTAVCAYAAAHPAVYFVLLGSENRTCEAGLPNIVHLPTTSDKWAKQRFLHTCNACIHAREYGETFGLSIAECSMAGLPVLTHAYPPAGAKHHLRVLGDAGKLYGDEFELEKLLLGFNASEEAARAGRYRALFTQFNPEAVMGTFLSVFGIQDAVIAAAGTARCREGE